LPIAKESLSKTKRNAQTILTFTKARRKWWPARALSRSNLPLL